MSTVDNLKALGAAVAECGGLVAGVVANGNDYLADLKYLPQLVSDGRDIETSVAAWQADLAEIKSLDDAGRADLAASWSASLPQIPMGSTVEAVLEQGVSILTYALEAVGFFLRTWGPKPAA